MAFFKKVASLLVTCVLSGTVAIGQNVTTNGSSAPKRHGGGNKQIVERQTQVGDSIPAVAELVADNVNLKNKRRLKEVPNAEHKALNTGVATDEELHFPSIDLYGEASWHNKAVNPFISGVKAEVPDSFAIDLTQFSYPLDQVMRVTSNYGYRRRYRRMHQGIDVKLQVGDTIRAVFDGRVRMVDFERSGYGKYVVLRHLNGLETLYAHCSKHLVKEGDIVRAGEPIALGGNTGRSTGSHLHFEARFMGQPLNPSHLIDFATGIPKNDSYLFVKAGNYKVKQGTALARKRSSTPSGQGIKLHKIKSGDTLWDIAKLYGTTVNELCRINGISKRTPLRVGRSLRVNG